MEQLFNQRQAAHLLRLSVRTLERHRVAGTGPRFVRLGRLVRYRAVDLADWVDGGLPPLGPPPPYWTGGPHGAGRVLRDVTNM
jgi:predicted DNA-binding transcriptional regulator AlpA